MIKEAEKLLRDYIFPENYTCELCGAEIFAGRLCFSCEKTVEMNDKHTCPVCGRKTAKSEICIECKARLPEFKKAVSAMVYGGGAVGLIAKFKNGGAYLADYFAELLLPKIKTFPHIDGITYVPMTKKAYSARGYNQAYRLAKSLSAFTGIPLLKDALAKICETRGQKTLGRAERAENLLNCFKADAKLVKGKSVLVVDDVLTTGATLDAVVSKLKKAGAAEVFAATAASVEYKIIPSQNNNGQK